MRRPRARWWCGGVPSALQGWDWDGQILPTTISVRIPISGPKAKVRWLLSSSPSSSSSSSLLWARWLRWCFVALLVAVADVAVADVAVASCRATATQHICTPDASLLCCRSFRVRSSAAPSATSTARGASCCARFARTVARSRTPCRAVHRRRSLRHHRHRRQRRRLQPRVWALHRVVTRTALLAPPTTNTTTTTTLSSL